MPVLLGGCWEVLRFLFLFYLLTASGEAGPAGAGRNALWLLLFGSGQMALAAGFLFLYLDRVRYGILKGFLVLAKILAVFSALLLVFLEPFGRGLVLPPLLAIWIVAFLDLLVLGILLSGRSTPGETGPPAPRPDFTETRIDLDDEPPS